MAQSIDSRTFTNQDSGWFASCSGDFNPVHLDPIVARRELPGALVVHGMHLLLWSLDAYCAILERQDIPRIRITRLQCSFRNPVYLDNPAEVRLVSENRDTATLGVFQDGQVAIKCLLTWKILEDACPAEMVPPMQKPWNRDAWDMRLDELLGKQGFTPVQIDEVEVRRHFKHLEKLSGGAWVADLMAITRIVGMQSPGLHSILFSIDLESQSGKRPTSLHYTVEAVDSGRNLVTMHATGVTMEGSVSAIYRPGPVKQMSYEKVRALVHADEFKNQRALIIGGSRGIGEATAKLIAAGGGVVWLTYHEGEQDARNVCQDINQGGGHSCFSKYRVGAADDDLEIVEQAGFAPTHVYYFATRRVTKSRRAAFSKAHFSAYSDIYVSGFAELHAACTGRWPHPIIYFFPSSVAVGENTQDLLEYSCAKAAGETLCDFLKALHPLNRIEVFRLPIVATDLSRGLIVTRTLDAVEVMLPIVRDMESPRAIHEKHGQHEGKQS